MIRRMSRRLESNLSNQVRVAARKNSPAAGKLFT